MGLACDILLIIIIILFVYNSAKRGFVRSILEVIGLFASVGAASYLSDSVADLFYNWFFRDSIIQKINTELGSIQSAEAVSEQLDLALSSVPEFVGVFHALFGVDSEMASSIDEWADHSYASEIIADRIVSPVLTGFIGVILFLVFFTLCMWLLNKVIVWISSLFEAPVIGAINRILGGILGFVKGIVFIVIMSLLLTFLSFPYYGGNSEKESSLLHTSKIVELVNDESNYFY